MRVALSLIFLFFSVLPATAGVHALALNGTPRYAKNFTHFDYVRPDAPKGGHVRMAAIGAFDSFNPFIVKGNAADGLGLLFDTLTVSSLDEPFTVYGLLANEMDVSASSITFLLRQEARFHDGSPVLASDVAFSFHTLLTQGEPHYAQYYADVERLQVNGPRSLTFFFKPDASRELPLILGQFPIFPEKYWQGRDFSASSLDIPVGSGPYRIGEFKAGQSLTLVRDPDYWGRNLPVNAGRNNFDSITYDYYRDMTVTLEAFKAGEYDLRQEYNSKQWATGYTGPAVDSGLIRTENIPHKLPQGMQAFVFNTRRVLFADPLVREALNGAFDFEWSNKNLFYSQYVRSTSFFSNSEMAATGLPSAGEKALLAGLDLPGQVSTPFELPRSDGSGNIREQLRQAAKLLQQAGWRIENGRLTKNGQPFVFEMLLVQPDFERVVLPFKRNLERLGIGMTVRIVDSSQYLSRLRDFDFDMIVGSFPQSLSPGNEQRSFWSSTSADIPGSRNYCGIKSPAIDKLVELVIAAPDRQTLIVRCKALDRALLRGWYVIPHWHLSFWRVAWWDKFGRPAKTPDYGLDFQTWWVDQGRAQALAAQRRELGLK